MDSSTHNPNPQPINSDVSNRSDEVNQTHSINPSQSSDEETIPSDDQEPAQPLDQELAMVVRDEDREYGCRYCDKRFSNKQALGGHQNAHKVERALEKNARDHVQENSIGYFAAAASTPFLGSYHRSHDLMNRTYLAWPYPPPHHGVHVGYGPRPGMPAHGEPYGPRPILGFNNAYPGWSQPLPRIPQFLGPHPPPYMNQGLNLGFPAAGAGSSSFTRPVTDHQGQLGFAGPSRIGPERNHGDANRVNRVNGSGNDQDDDSGLDLTLKL